MVSIKVDIEFNRQESELLEMAANLGGQQPTSDQLKSILLHAAFGCVKRFSMGVLENHHAGTNPPTIDDAKRRLHMQATKARRDLARISDELARLDEMRLPTVRLTPKGSKMIKLILAVVIFTLTTGTLASSVITCDTDYDCMLKFGEED